MFFYLLFFCFGFRVNDFVEGEFFVALNVLGLLEHNGMNFTFGQVELATIVDIFPAAANEASAEKSKVNSGKNTAKRVGPKFFIPP